MWLKLLLEAVVGWAPLGEYYEKTFERWSECWGKPGRFPGVRRGKRVVVSWDMCEDRGKPGWVSDRERLWAGWEAGLSGPRECGGSWGIPLPPCSIPLPSRPQQAPGDTSPHPQSTLLWHPHVNTPQSCTEQLPSSQGNNKQCENFSKVFTTLFH